MPKLSPPPLSLYVHLPWCIKKCPYCDFNSHELQGALPQQRYVDALLADFEQELPGVWGRPVVSVFLGGGTPSLFQPEQVDRLLSGIHALVAVRPGAEVTLEVNPGTVEHGPFAEYLAAGINRLSIGVQSFDPQKLSLLGRIHSVGEARQAVEQAQAAGFDNINLDLMYGLPEQTVDQALDDLQLAVALQPRHISRYQLTLEPNTVFAKYPPRLPDPDTCWAMQESGELLLAKHGYAQYEVSAYAQPGRQCLHNLNYWRFGDYIGIGAGAHSKLTDAAQQRVWRSAKLRDPQRYLTKAASVDRIGEQRDLEQADRRFEFVLNALRLNDGFPVSDYPQRTGHQLDLTESPWLQGLERGLLVADQDRVRPTALGLRFLNDLIAPFLPDAAN